MIRSGPVSFEILLVSPIIWLNADLDVINYRHGNSYCIYEFVTNPPVTKRDNDNCILVWYQTLHGNRSGNQNIRLELVHQLMIYL